MALSPGHRPRRQDSTISSTSSGNRTIRASANGGRRRSSTTTTDAATALFARLRGTSIETNGEDDSESEEVEDEGAGDYQSPIMLPSRAAESSIHKNSGAGPSDYFYRSPSPPGPPDLSRSGSEYAIFPLSPLESIHGVVQDGSRPPRPESGHSPSAFTETLQQTESELSALPDTERYDNWEYERRLQGILAIPSTQINGSVSNGLNHQDGYFAIPPRLDMDDSRMFRDTAGLEIEEGHPREGIGGGMHRSSSVRIVLLYLTR